MRKIGGGGGRRGCFWIYLSSPDFLGKCWGPRTWARQVTRVAPNLHLLHVGYLYVTHINGTTRLLFREMVVRILRVRKMLYMCARFIVSLEGRLRSGESQRYISEGKIPPSSEIFEPAPHHLKFCCKANAVTAELNRPHTEIHSFLEFIRWYL